MAQEVIPRVHKPNGRMWKRASGQAAAKSLEWTHRGKILNMAEFDLKKGPFLEEKTLIVDRDGSVKTADEYGYISPDQNSLKLGNVPYFLKSSKIREIIYVVEGVCAIKSCRLWRNCL